jgi:hypothetical protein
MISLRVRPFYKVVGMRNGRVENMMTRGSYMEADKHLRFAGWILNKVGFSKPGRQFAILQFASQLLYHD